MPLYDFKCTNKKCGFKFSEFLEVGGVVEICPYCQQPEVERDFSEIQKPQQVQNYQSSNDPRTRVKKFIEDMKGDLGVYRENSKDNRR